MAITRAERRLLESRIIRLATLGALSAAAIAAELGIPESNVRRILSKHQARLDRYDHEIDRHLTNTQLASFTEARRLIFESLPEAAARLTAHIRSNDPKVSLQAIQEAFKSSGLSEAPSQTTETQTRVTSPIHIEQALIALQSAPPMPPLPTGLPSDHPLAMAQRGALGSNPSPNNPGHGNEIVPGAPLPLSQGLLPKGDGPPSPGPLPPGASEPKRMVPRVS